MSGWPVSLVPDPLAPPGPIHSPGAIEWILYPEQRAARHHANGCLAWWTPDQGSGVRVCGVGIPGDDLERLARWLSEHLPWTPWDFSRYPVLL